MSFVCLCKHARYAGKTLIAYLAILAQTYFIFART